MRVVREHNGRLEQMRKLLSQLGADKEVAQSVQEVILFAAGGTCHINGSLQMSEDLVHIAADQTRIE